MTDKEILALYEQGMTRPQIAHRTGKTERQVRRAIERARIDPAVSDAMTAVGTGMVPSTVWIKSKTHSIQLKPAVADEGDLLARMVDAFEGIPAYEPVAVDLVQSDLLHVYGLFDAHIGMRAWGKETYSQDYDLKLAEQDIKSAITRLTEDGGEALLIVGGDTLHHDNNENCTPASKHPLDVDGRHRLVVETTIRSIAWAAEHLATRHERVTIKVHRGNHDVVSHLILAFALKERYRESGRIVVDMNETDWFWKQWGKCAIFTTHGDKPRSPDTFIHKMSDICPFWSLSPHRVAITGHVHKMQMSRIGGALWCSVDGFCPPDEYGSQFPGRRGMAKMTFDKERGMTGMKFDPVWRE